MFTRIPARKRRAAYINYLRYINAKAKNEPEKEPEDLFKNRQPDPQGKYRPPAHARRDQAVKP